MDSSLGAEVRTSVKTEAMKWGSAVVATKPHSCSSSSMGLGESRLVMRASRVAPIRNQPASELCSALEFYLVQIAATIAPFMTNPVPISLACSDSGTVCLSILSRSRSSWRQTRLMRISRASSSELKAAGTAHRNERVRAVHEASLANLSTAVEASERVDIYAGTARDTLRAAAPEDRVARPGAVVPGAIAQSGQSGSIALGSQPTAGGRGSVAQWVRPEWGYRRERERRR